MKDIFKKLLNYIHRDVYSKIDSSEQKIQVNIFNSYDSLKTLIESKSDEIKALQANILSTKNTQNIDMVLNNIQLAEFKVYSQWGDDGIIQFLTDYLKIENKIFIEFGVENYKESNTRHLLISKNWKGIVFDGTESNIEQIINDRLYWKYNLTAEHQFITKENINKLIKKFNLPEEIGLLHIDIDGNDYWILNEINSIKPIILIMEYNSVFGLKPWTIPYEKDFNRTKAHYSNLYFGSSLKSIYDLATYKGYSFIGCNSAGNNAYFILNKYIKNIGVKSLEEGYVYSSFRESRDEKGNLNYISEEKRLKILKGMPIFNTHTNKLEKIV